MAEPSPTPSTMSMRDVIEAIEPLDGNVVPIKTIQETRPPRAFKNAYVAEVNMKSASQVIKVLDSKFPRDPKLPLQHLRRFCKREMLPDTLKQYLDEHHPHKIPMAATLFVIVGLELPDIEALRTLLEPFMPVPRPRSHSPAASHQSESSSGSSPEPPRELTLFATKVPIHPPVDNETAERWSKTMWPVIYNAAAARSTMAPPLQMLARAKKSIEPRAGYYLSLAREVAKEAYQSGRGRAVGAVIVDPEIEYEIDEKAWEEGYNSRERWMHAVIAVAGDCRYARSEAGGPSQTSLHSGAGPNPAAATYNSDLEGGPDLHAVMRAVEMVARSRRDAPGNENPMPSEAYLPLSCSDPQLSEQLSDFEQYFLYEAGNHIVDDGYTSGSGSGSGSSSPRSHTLSPRKRKYDEPNPESTAAALDIQAGIEQLSPPPIPAPPPLDPIISDPSNSHLFPTGQNESPGSTSRIRGRAQGGYLCTGLDLYLSNEPCLCCCMGALLSRFRSVIFPRAGRMDSGGLVTQPVVPPPPRDDSDDEEDTNGQANHPDEMQDRQYYGLHWRKELNWRALGFEFVEDYEDDDFSIGEVSFHA